MKCKFAKRILTVLLIITVLSSVLLPAAAGNDLHEISSVAGEVSRIEAAQPEDDTLTIGDSDEEEVDEPATENISDSIDELLLTEVHNAYVEGTSWTEFEPDRNITRAEAAQMFFNLLREVPEGTASFIDVPEDSWMTEPIGALAYLGAIKGVGEEKYSPYKRITRAEFVTIASRFAKMKDGINNFSDVDITSWSAKYIISACAYGWIDGFDDGTFRPRANITRAQAVKIINGMLGREADALVEDIGFTKRFEDVRPEHWAFGDICEAATDHEHIYLENGREAWKVKEEDVSHWVTEEVLDESGAVIAEEEKYFDAVIGDFASGLHWVKDRVLYFEPETNYLRSGWIEIDGANYLCPTREEELFPYEIGNYLTQVNYNDDYRTWEDIEYITVHYTASPGDTAYGECAHFYNTYRAASAQYFVDERSIWRCVEDEDIAWHVGNDTYYHDEARNYNTIGIEMCCRKSSEYSGGMSAYDQDWYFLSGTLDNSSKLVRSLMMKYGIPVQNVIRHADVTQKVCPAMFVWNYQNWKDYLNLVTEYEIDYDGRYQARIKTDDARVRSGPDMMYQEVGKLSMGDIVTVYEERLTRNTSEGRWGRIGEDEWVSLPSISRLGA